MARSSSREAVSSRGDQYCAEPGASRSSRNRSRVPSQRARVLSALSSAAASISVPWGLIYRIIDFKTQRRGKTSRDAGRATQGRVEPSWILSVNGRPDIRPDLIDLFTREHAAPGRHVLFAVEHRVDEALTL